MRYLSRQKKYQIKLTDVLFELKNDICEKIKGMYEKVYDIIKLLFNCYITEEKRIRRTSNIG